VPDEAIVQRLSSRRVCESCRLTQSVSDPDAPAESCPYCGGTLVRRNDDDVETVRRRLSTYASFAGPVIAFYGSRDTFISVNGLRHPDQVTQDLFRKIGEKAAIAGAF
jgi:adenylate kinase